MRSRRAPQIGPVVEPGQLKQDEDYIAIGRKEGAELVAGGERLDARHRGLLPLAGAVRRGDERDADQPGGDLRAGGGRDPGEGLRRGAGGGERHAFGLSSGICTTSLKHATHFKRNAEAGMVMVNLPTAGVDFHVPFGGRKGSSFGPREQGRYAVEFYTTVKTAYTLA